MAIHASSTPALARPLLPEALPSGGLLPARRAELLAILEDAPPPFAYASRGQRAAIQAGLDALIDYLDALDLDADLEDDGCAEPYMSRCETGAGAQPCFEVPGLDECEPDGDSEPSLGSLGSTCGVYYADQRLWARGTTDDREEENEHGGDILDERHDEEDDEHSLGAPEIHHDQRRWSQGRRSREMDHDEHAGLRSFGYGEARVARDRVRRETEAMLRRHRLIHPPSDVLCDRGGNVIEFRGRW